MVDWIARRIWFALLWWIRGPFIRRMQRAGLRLVPNRYRDRARQAQIAQERFARRIGLPLLRFLISVFLLSVAASLLFRFAIYAIEQEWIPLEFTFS